MISRAADSPPRSARSWRSTFATLTLVVYAAAAFYFFFTVALPWATSSLGEPWTFSRFVA